MIKVEFELPEHSISKELSTEEYGFETEADVYKIIEKEYKDLYYIINP